jgi:hypothetical protein
MPTAHSVGDGYTLLLWVGSQVAREAREAGTDGYWMRGRQTESTQVHTAAVFWTASARLISGVGPS